MTDGEGATSSNIELTTTTDSDGNNGDNENNADTNTNQKSASLIPTISVYSIMSGNVFQSNACNKITDFILIFFSIGGMGFGVIAWFIIDSITAIGYIFAGIFSGISLCSIRRMRIRASLQSSVNVLKEENDELKENNDELKENIDELEENIDGLELVSQTLTSEIEMFKNTVGIFGENSAEMITNLREIYQNLKKENAVQVNINKNAIYLHILHIITHFDKSCNFTLTKENLEKAKKSLLNAFPNLDYESLQEKLKNTNKITAEKIAEHVNLQTINAAK
jgi:hypothetical protein